MFKNKILLITGGSGSFGNAVLRKFLDSGVKEVPTNLKREARLAENLNLSYNQSSFYS